MKYKLIAFDLDGTLLRDDKSLTERSLNALRAAHEHGALIVPATGRIYKGVPAPLRTEPFARFFITINGAKVYDAREDAVLSRSEIPNETAQRLIAYMDALDVIYDCYKDDWGYVSRAMYERAGDYISDRGILELFLRTRTPVEDLKTFLREDGGSVQKLQMHFRSMHAKKKELETLPALFPEIAVSSSVPSNIELNIGAANKGEALAVLCGRLGIRPENTLAFGDGTNDLSLLRTAGTGVAMGNAAFAVKAAADAVCGDNERDGLAKYLEKLLEEDP
ncbi:MAG: HAD family phosphatase [Oscillospiraceae bacterium]|nr:HAD family phosphatase [Oscillospiraceae bacterium]